jgi:hypothetical protein
MDISSYSHLVDIDEENGQLIIHRVFSDGKKQLYTEVKLPERRINLDDSAFANFARMIGENILMDSPAARRALDI